MNIPGLSNLLRPKLYVACHRTCGHALIGHTDRDTLEHHVATRIAPRMRFVIRIRVASDRDRTSLAQGLTCNLCYDLVRRS